MEAKCVCGRTPQNLNEANIFSHEKGMRAYKGKVVPKTPRRGKKETPLDALVAR